MPSKNDEFTELSAKKSTSMPRLTRDRYKTNKIYRAPPTPPLEKQIDLERSFKLDCIAVSNISLDYSRANPKFGSVIPPYNSLDDKSISEAVKNNGVREFLRRNGQSEIEHDSMSGRVYDYFYKQGTGFKYLNRRNLFGNGHHPENIDGHLRYMAEQPRVMFSYNNMFGFRRNVPKLRTEPPSTFSVDPTYYTHLLNSYSNQYSEDEILEHFKNTFMIGYPFHDNNYNNFHPTVRYIITVKTGGMSQEQFLGNLGINIVSRNFDTGFIRLDENILVKQNNGENTKKLFKRGHKDIFQFEDQDIRTISAIILSRDGKGDELLYLDYVEVEIQKVYEKQTYRFPFEGWVRMSRQDKKTEQLKARFGKKNSVVVYPNDKPKYEYRIKVSPQLNLKTEYTIKINYDLKKQDNLNDYKIEFSSELPKTGRILLCLHGIYGQSEVFKFSNDTEPIDNENKLTFQIKCKEIGEITQVSVLYDETTGQKAEFNLRVFQITDSNGQSYEFIAEQPLKANKEKFLKVKIFNSTSESENSDLPPEEIDAWFTLKLESKTDATSLFALKEPIENNDGVVTFKKVDQTIKNIDKVSIKIESDQKYFASIKSIQVLGNKGQEFISKKLTTLKSGKEIFLRDESKGRSNNEAINKQGDVLVQIVGDKRRTDVFPLKALCDDDSEAFAKIDYDLGKIKNVMVRYQDKAENQIELDFVEIIDPRGNSYKFKTEVTLSGNQEVMLPRMKTTEEILLKEASILDDMEIDENKEKAKKPEIKTEQKMAYETKGFKEKERKPFIKKSLVNTKKESLQPETKREPTKVEIKSETAKVEAKKEPTVTEPEKEPTKTELKKEPNKVEFNKEATKIEFNKETTKVDFKKEPTKSDLMSRESPKLSVSKEPSRTESKVESKPEPKIESRPESKAESRAQTNIESNVAPKEKAVVPSPSPDIEEIPDTVEYGIKLKKGAGAFGAPIKVILTGEKGSTEVIDLAAKSEHMIEINKVDEFKINEKDIGKITKMNFSYEGTETIWYLNEIQVIKNSATFTFPIERGFTKPEKLDLEVGQRPPSPEKEIVNLGQELNLFGATKTPSIASGKKSPASLHSAASKLSNRAKSKTPEEKEADDE